MQEYRDNTESRREKLHAEIDKKWAKKLAREKEIEERRSRQEETRLKELKEAQAALTEKRLLSLVQKLDQLRMLRRERLKREGHFFPEEDQEFYERIQQQEQGLARRKKEQEERQDKKKQVRNERVEARQQRMAQQKKLEQSEETAIGSNDSNEGRKGRVKKQRPKEPIPSEVTHLPLLSPSPIFPPPHAVAQTLDIPSTLIELSEQEACDQRDPEEIQMIRELWAHYVVDEDSPDGSCIPLDLGYPPLPSSHFWAALLFK
ncbi:hypothetical protein BG006_009530 [Podila minutissima]|uniref:Uncharacterized protein n=1 Tax=Podila minutissima TaxID=64525 RepID=A0A9P5VRD3_9FUNG|nr:hypothetical protein BG006_009530 [Podila minutissima]